MAKKKWTPELREAAVEHICAELEKKRSLTTICEQDSNVPSMAELMRWQREEPAIRASIADARTAMVEKLLEENLAIADNATDDVRIVERDGKRYAKIDGDCVRRAQLRISTRESFARLMIPERFNQQRMDVTSGGKALPAPVQINDNRIQALLTLAAHRAAQLAEPVLLTPPSIDDVMG